MWMEFIFEAILIAITGSFGIIGNISLTTWFANMDKKLHFHYLMITLAFFDTTYIVTCILVFSVPLYFEGETIKPYYYYIVPKAIPIAQIALTGSTYCTGAISVERYLTVCHPFYSKQKRWSSKRYILPIIAFCLIYNAPRFFELRTKVSEVDLSNRSNGTKQKELSYATVTNLMATKEFDSVNQNDSIDSVLEQSIMNREEHFSERKFDYHLELTYLRESTIYYSAYTIGLNFFFNGFFPFALIISMNIVMYRTLMIILGDPYNRIRECSIVSIDRNIDSNATRLRRGSELKRIKPSDIVLAKFNLLLVAVFITCHSVRWVPNIYELIQRLTSKNDMHWPEWVEDLTNVSNFVTVLNSSVNFYIYYLAHQGLPIYKFERTKRNSSNIEMKDVETLI